MEVELETIKKIYSRGEELEENDIKLVINYLTKYFKIESVKVEYAVDNQTSADMTISSTKDDGIKITVYKNKFHNVLEIFKAFTHEFYHLLQHVNRNKVKIYKTMFGINDMVDTYSKMHGYNYYRDNSTLFFFELDAEIQSLNTILNNMENGTWSFFNQADIDEIRAIKNRTEMLTHVRIINFLGKTYIPYDSGLVDILIKIIIDSNPNKYVDPDILKFFDSSVDIVDMILLQENEPIFLRDYIIWYLIEENFLQAENIINKIITLSSQDRKTFDRVLESMCTELNKEIERLRTFKHNIDSLIEEKNRDIILKHIDMYIKAYSQRLNKVDEFKKNLYNMGGTAI